MSKFKVSVRDIRNQPQSIFLSGAPDECPMCRLKGVQIGVLYSSLKSSGRLVICVYKCPSEDCQELFLTNYAKYDTGQYRYETSYPVISKPAEFGEEIKSNFESFVKIYNQALNAEEKKMDQLAGMGYRKALEFLVKDFIIKKIEKDEKDKTKAKEKSEKIKHTLLGSCINNHVDDPRVQVCAKRATWLGNDHTHYIKKWEDKNIEDLKLLIKLTVNWIESGLLTDKYEKEMKP